MENQSVVAESNLQRLQAQLAGVLAVQEVSVLQAPERIVAFRGQLLQEAESAYALLRERFHTLGYTPLLERRGENEVVIAQQGVVEARPTQPWINVALFIATFLSTLVTSAMNEVAQSLAEQVARPEALGGALVEAFLRNPLLLLKGLPFSLTLMSILLAHEMGHYLVGRRYNAPVSLPYFIPLPIVGLFGTMGAVIVQRAPFEERRSLFDIGVAGPLAGMAVALPLLVYGLATSAITPIPPGSLMEGNSILYLALKFAIFGRVLPSGGMDVSLNSVAWAAWGGLLITSLNLLPVGQLDGGHILYSLLGKRAWPVAYVIVGLLVVLGFVWNGWFLWAFLVLMFGVRHPSPLNDLMPLGLRRTLMGLGVLVLFILLFTPIPLTQLQ